MSYFTCYYLHGRVYKMIDYNDKALLGELKQEYDKTLKRSYLKAGNGFYDSDFPYSPKYPLYFNKSILKNLINGMRKDVYSAYKDGAGHELDEGPNGIPPKFLSIGSSSCFCFICLNINEYINKKEGADFFSHEGERVKRTYFEKPLPVLDGVFIPPHIDAYAKTAKGEYFFECKCHEMFDDHPIKLSKKYFKTDKDLVVDYIPDKYLKEEGGMISINPSAFDVDDAVFDIKQLLTHLMGIVCNRSKKNCDLIYFYSFPKEEDIEDERLVEIIDKVKFDAVRIFESKIIKDYCSKHNIRIRMYGHNSADHHAASEKNSYKIYEMSL